MLLFEPLSNLSHPGSRSHFGEAQMAKGFEGHRFKSLNFLSRTHNAKVMGLNPGVSEFSSCFVPSVPTGLSKGPGGVNLSMDLRT